MKILKFLGYLLCKALELLGTEYRIGQLFKIPIKFQGCFILLIILNVYYATGSWLDKSYILLLNFSLYFCVLLHELGHCFTAKYFSHWLQPIEIQEISLWPFGGFAKIINLDKLSPSQDIIVSLAGPLVNWIIFGSLSLIFFNILEYPWTTSAQLLRIPSWDHWISFLILINLVIGTFNLIPAFPLDGGRVLRSLLAQCLNDTSRASWISARITQGLALAGLISYPFLADFQLFLISVFILLFATLEILTLKNQNYHLVASQAWKKDGH